MYSVQFTPRGERELKALPRSVQQRILTKLEDNVRLPRPLVRAKPLTDLPPATHRFRVGIYRLSFYIEGAIIFVERVEKRDRAYHH